MFPNPFDKKSRQRFFGRFRRDAPIIPFDEPLPIRLPDDLRRNLARAELLRNTMTKRIDKSIKQTHGSNPFQSDLYFMSPIERMNAETANQLHGKRQLDLATQAANIRFNRRLKDYGFSARDQLGENFGLVATEAKGVPRDVVLNLISPYLQPSAKTSQDEPGPEPIEYLDKLMTMTDYPIDVPAQNSNMSPLPFGKSGSIPNLGFGF